MRVTIPLSGTATPAFQLANARHGATILLPVVNSTAIFLLAAEAVDGTFRRVHRDTGSLYSVDPGLGSIAITLTQDLIGGADWAKLEVAAQEAARDVDVMFKL